jgi:hypothetical protein
VNVNSPRKTVSTESSLTQSVGSRIKPKVVEQLRQYAALDNVTPSAWIAKVVVQEIARRKAAANAS